MCIAYTSHAYYNNKRSGKVKINTPITELY